jgi:hypothetical protein
MFQKIKLIVEWLFDQVILPWLPEKEEDGKDKDV